MYSENDGHITKRPEYYLGRIAQAMADAERHINVMPDVFTGVCDECCDRVTLVEDLEERYDGRYGSHYYQKGLCIPCWQRYMETHFGDQDDFNSESSVSQHSYESGEEYESGEDYSSQGSDDEDTSHVAPERCEHVCYRCQNAYYSSYQGSYPLCPQCRNA